MRWRTSAKPEGWLAVAYEDGWDALEETPKIVATEVAQILGFRAEFGWPLLIETALVALEPVPVR